MYSLMYNIKSFQLSLILFEVSRIIVVGSSIESIISPQQDLSLIVVISMSSISWSQSQLQSVSSWLLSRHLCRYSTSWHVLPLWLACRVHTTNFLYYNMIFKIMVILCYTYFQILIYSIYFRIESRYSSIFHKSLLGLP